jgi:hypothetical protein
VTPQGSKVNHRRERAAARIPRWYVPWFHLAAPSAVGLALIAVALSHVHQPSWGDALFVLGVLALANAVEWGLHRNVLHRRFPGLVFAFAGHTPDHHGAFSSEDLAIHSAREMKLVLMPGFGVVGMFLGTIPPGLAIGALLSPNLGALWIATGIGYVIAYEWMHLSYHLPPEGPIGRLGVIRALRRHHALHHRPELMQHWNFNVTLPLCDWLFRTRRRPEPTAPSSPPPPRKAA